MNWPNILTFIRILLIPLFVIAFYLPVQWGHLVAAILFALAAFTDWLDGYLARTLKQFTKLGAFLDPVADKLIVSVALILIVAQPIITVHAAVITIPAAIIVAREIIVSALREWMAELGKRTHVAVSYLGKVKTVLQMLALLVLIYCTNETNFMLVLAGFALLYTAAILTIWSMLIYVQLAWKELREMG